MRSRSNRNEAIYKRLAAEAEAEFRTAKDHLTVCEASPLVVGGEAIMAARQRWGNANAKYNAALKAYGKAVIDSGA
jgi:hypothetical protein